MKQDECIAILIALGFRNISNTKWLTQPHIMGTGWRICNMDLVQWREGRYSTITWKVEGNDKIVWDSVNVTVNNAVCNIPIKTKSTNYRYNALVIDYTDKPDGGITVNFMYLRIYRVR